MKVLILPLLFAIISTPPASFKADRPRFFKQCALVTNFTLDSTEKNAVAVGKTRLSTSMRAGIDVIFDSWEAEGDSDKRRLAYILATARRESMGTFAPVREVMSCKDDDECRERKIGAELARRAKEKNRKARPNYAVADGFGRRYYGRGYVQLTLPANYDFVGKELRLDLVGNPEKVLEPSIASTILVRGMLRGWFGSREPLSHYIDGDAANWHDARNSVNPYSPNKPITAAMAVEIDQCLHSQS